MTYKKVDPNPIIDPIMDIDDFIWYWTNIVWRPIDMARDKECAEMGVGDE
jgi:hypothetical protein